MGPVVVGWSDRKRMAARLTLVVLSITAGTVSAQDYLGPAKCKTCHEDEKGLTSHAKSLAQLSDPKAKEYAKAVGGDPKAQKCLVCHAPPALAAGPVSCENCHGPGKGYLAPHKKLPFYSLPPAQQMGMIVLYNNANAIAKLCVDCHVLNDKAMKEAGHPLGDKFDVGGGLSRMVHWPSGSVNETRVRGYDKAFYASVSKAGAPTMAARVAAAGGPSGGKPAAGGPAPLPPTKPGGPGAAPPGKPAAGPAPGPRPPKPPPAASAASEEYLELGPEEFTVPEGGAEAPPAAEPGGTPVAPPPPAPKPPPIERLTIPDPPSGAFQETSTVRPPPAPEAIATTAAPAGTPAVPAPPRTARNATELRGRAAVLLADLIRQKPMKQLPLPAPAPPAEFAGPDGELLHLQDAILALALETLRKKP